MHRRGLAAAPAVWVALFLMVMPAAAAPLEVGRYVANLEFPRTLDRAHNRYLGLAKSGKFTLPDLKAPYVLLEVLNTDCPHCETQAPLMNLLYRRVQESDLRDRLRFIAVVSDPPAAAREWQRIYRIPFAVVADPGWKIAQKLQIRGTPTTVVLDRNGKVVFLHAGVFHDLQKVFQQLQARLP